MTVAESVAHLHAAMRHDFRVIGIMLGVIVGLLVFIALSLWTRR